MPHTGAVSTSKDEDSLSHGTASEQSVDSVSVVDSKAPKQESTDVSNDGSTEFKKNQHIVIDTLASTDSLRSFSSKRSTLSRASLLARKKKEDALNIGLIIFQLILVVVNFYFAVASPGDGCAKGAYSFDTNVFCLLASTLSLPLLVISVSLWKKGRNPHNPRHRQNSQSKTKTTATNNIGVGKVVFCISFWNFILAVLGVMMYIGQFTDECRAEPIAIVILLWSTFQFSFACMSVGVCCYLSYSAVAKSARAAEDVLSAGAVFAA